MACVPGGDMPILLGIDSDLMGGFEHREADFPWVARKI
jgi:hypothetical protein